MKRVVLIITTAFTIGISLPAQARCPMGFSAPEGYNHCVPTDRSDRLTWETCGKEPSQYGLNESEPCMSLDSRIRLADKYTEYCRKLKLPHLYKQGM